MNAVIGKGDLLIVLLMMLLTYYLFTQFWRTGDGAAEYVHIINGSEEVMRVPVRENAIVPIKGQLGETRIEIESGRVRIKDSACKRKLCVHRGWSDRNGEIIACLPNRVSVYLSGRTGGYDTINF